MQKLACALALLFAALTLAAPLQAAAYGAQAPSHCANMQTQHSNKHMAACCDTGCHCPLSQSPAVPPLMAAALPRALPVASVPVAANAALPSARVLLPERPPRA